MKPKLQLDHTRVEDGVFHIMFRTDDFSVPQPEWPPDDTKALGMTVRYTDNGNKEGSEFYECACYINVFSRNMFDVINSVEYLCVTFNVVGYRKLPSETEDLKLRVELNTILQKVLSC